jgi:hypothetical protein
MLPDGFIAGTLSYSFDYARIADEILACRDFFVYTPPYRHQVERGLTGAIPFRSESAENYRRIDTFEDGEIRRRSLRGVKIFYLRNSRDGDVLKDSRFSVTKTLRHSSWYWRAEIAERIPYTMQCIESLPYRTLGLIRTFVCEDSFMPTHRDTFPDPRTGIVDRAKSIGISLIPATGGVGMKIWDAAAQRVREVPGHCLVFDDACWHGVPMTRGARITLRIFGELDADALWKQAKRVWTRQAVSHA